QTRIAQCYRVCWPRGFDAESAHDLRCDRTSKRRRYSVANLTGAMPLGGVQPKPIGESVQARHLAHRDTAVVAVVDRAWTCEGPARAICTRAKCVRNAIGRKLEKPAYGFDGAGRGLCEPSPRDLCMTGAGAGREDPRVPDANVPVVPSIVRQATHFRSVWSWSSEL